MMLPNEITFSSKELGDFHFFFSGYNPKQEPMAYVIGTSSVPRSGLPVDFVRAAVEEFRKAGKVELQTVEKFKPELLTLGELSWHGSYFGPFAQTFLNEVKVFDRRYTSLADYLSMSSAIGNTIRDFEPTFGKPLSVDLLVKDIKTVPYSGGIQLERPAGCYEIHALAYRREPVTKTD